MVDQKVVKLSDRFIEGLEKYNLTADEIKGWKYCGGDSDHHRNYFRMMYGNYEDFPDHEDFCVCGHEIKRNCYIRKGDILLVLGICCIKRFIDTGAKRTCVYCSKPHRSKKFNFCKSCRHVPKAMSYRVESDDDKISLYKVYSEHKELWDKLKQDSQNKKRSLLYKNIKIINDNINMVKVMEHKNIPLLPKLLEAC